MSIEQLRVAFQGDRGAFSELAVRHWWRGTGEPLPCPTFTSAIDAVVDGRADAAVIPVENRIVGDVHGALDALAAAGIAIRITSHVTVPVQHALLAHDGATLASVRVVRSHPVALAQCGAFLARHGYVTEEAWDTAGAARAVAESGEVQAAA
nr:hypothetical protein [Gemmatimonadaceae bacterium]